MRDANDRGSHFAAAVQYAAAAGQVPVVQALANRGAALDVALNFPSSQLSRAISRSPQAACRAMTSSQPRRRLRDAAQTCISRGFLVSQF